MIELCAKVANTALVYYQLPPYQETDEEQLTRLTIVNVLAGVVSDIWSLKEER